MDREFDFYYKCLISEDVLWLLYYKENRLIQDCYKIPSKVNAKKLTPIFDEALTRQIIRTICQMTEKPGTAIPAQIVMDSVYDEDKAILLSSFGRNIRNLGSAFERLGQELRIKYSDSKKTGPIIVSKIEKIRIDNTNESDSKVEKDDTYSTVAERDLFYIEEIKKRLLQFTGSNTRVEISALENRLFYETRCERLSDKAKKIIDAFFSSEVQSLLVDNGISEALAEWYATIWTLFIARENYKRTFELCERAQLYERSQQVEINLLNVEADISDLAEKIHSYNQSLEKGGKM